MYQKQKEGTPLAFSIVTHDAIGLFEILLHLIFRPYNAYCIYVAKNTNKGYQNKVHQLVDCYKKLYPKTSIFMVEKTNSISWGNWTVLEADLTCMNHLLQLKKQ